MEQQISARNYAAQAVRDIHRYANYLDTQDMNLDARVLRRAADVILRAQHFSIGDNGMLLDDGLRGLDGREIHLPYPAITIEIFDPPEPQSATAKEGRATPFRTVLLACECLFGDIVSVVPVLVRDDIKHPYAADTPGIWTFTFLDNAITHRTGFHPLTYCVFIPQHNFMTHSDEGPRVSRAIYAWLLDSIGKCEDTMLVDECTAYMKRQHEAAFVNLYPVMALCEALTCMNVRATTVQHTNPQVNARRERNGKLPLLETKILTVDIGPDHGDTRTGRTAPSERHGPRAHLRRGHIRRLPSGNIWINSMIVAARNGGWIEKGYDIMTPGAPRS